MLNGETPTKVLSVFNDSLFRVLLAHAPIGIGCFDLELRFICINDKLAEINGISASEHIGRHLAEIAPTLLTAAQRVVGRILSTGQPVEDQEFCGETCLHPGTTRCWSESWYPLRDDMAEIIGFAVIVREITERKRAEKEIREREDLLIGVNQILHAALTCETERELGLTCLNVIKKITRSHIGFIAEMTDGLSNIALINNGWEACDVLPAGHYSTPGKFEIRGIFGRVVLDRKGLFTNNPANHPDSIDLPEGHPPLSSFLAVPLIHEESVFGMLAVGNREGGYTQAEQDVLEALSPSVVEAFLRKRAKDEIEALNHELELRVERRTLELQETQLQYLHAEKLSAIGKLSASIAHEFNSPLQAVMTILKCLELSASLQGDERKLLAAAIGESQRMKELIRSLQDFYRPSPGMKVPMDVHATIDSVILLCNIDFRRKKILTSLNYAKKSPHIIAIPDQIKQVFLNLLNNAADACAEEGGLILITTRQEERGITVKIQDPGIGIEPDNMEKIFQPFFTTKPMVKGTGLGLSVCYGIVQSHGGEIRVESEPGAGSTFTVYLPITSGA